MRVTVVDGGNVHVVSAGVQGPPGSGSAFIHDQPVAQAVWIITHNMNKYPSVVITDVNMVSIDGLIEYLSLTSLQITFNSNVAGKAVLN